MKKEEIFLDLSKCSQEEIENVLAVLPEKEFDNQYEINEAHKYLHFVSTVKTWWVFDELDVESKTEINYTQFMELFKVRPTELEKEMFDVLNMEKERQLGIGGLKDTYRFKELDAVIAKYKQKYGG